MPKIIDYPEDPKYNIKSVSQRTGVQPVTLRAWERRYKILNPQRAENGYRLYSERDMALLSWLKTQVDSGLSISTAVADFRTNMSNGDSPEAIISTSAPIPSKRSSLPPSNFTSRIYKALVSHDESLASDVFEEALASFDLLPLFESVLIPTLVEIGEGWFHGKVTIATEHFATNFLRARLMAIFQSMPPTRLLTKVMVGGAPGDLHEIGGLMVAILLRDSGYRVEYLGPDLPLDDLVYYAKNEKPKMIILTATIKESIIGLANFDKMLQTIRPKPVFGFGGGAFLMYPELAGQTPGIYLGESMTQSLKTIQTILDGKKVDPWAG